MTGVSPPPSSFRVPTMIAILLGTFFIGFASSGLVKYDQTQTGDYNVHLDLKNIEILAFLDDTSNGEYDYDYAELTLKPPAAPSTSKKPTTSSDALDPMSTVDLLSSDTASNSTTTPSSSSVTTEVPTSAKPHRRCGAGFYRDPNGRCRRLRRPIKLRGILQHAKNKLIA
ncbi:uncharacterized protein LOC106661339 [Cimex lectularius]|uniref:Uncharacterized protein n=1 Tax=Cimex lectularius TaxID=79782 RepID=A0A8I6R7W5_CIMLE|nr:uncharacterized protein LOC106661339 [Cimex lectularius]